jgi:hypothetical protein
VVAHPTAEFLGFMAQHGTSFEDAAAARERDGGEQNRRETPLFAARIEPKALSGSQQADSRRRFIAETRQLL